MSGFYNPMMKTPDFGQGFGDIMNQIMQMLMIKKMYPNQQQTPNMGGPTPSAPSGPQIPGGPSMTSMGGPSSPMGGGVPGGPGMTPTPQMGGSMGGGLAGMDPEKLRMLIMMLMQKGMLPGMTGMNQ
jgi:hypothetical protein